MSKLYSALFIIGLQFAMAALGMIILVVITNITHLVAALADGIAAHRFTSALFISVIIGIPVTWAWSNFCHRFYRENSGDQRYHALSITFGVLERTLITTLVLWLPMAVGPFAGAWLVVKSIVGWAGMDVKEHAARARFSVTLFGSLVSILWALGWGIWGMSPPK